MPVPPILWPLESAHSRIPGVPGGRTRRAMRIERNEESDMLGNLLVIAKPRESSEAPPGLQSGLQYEVVQSRSDWTTHGL